MTRAILLLALLTLPSREVRATWSCGGPPPSRSQRIPTRQAEQVWAAIQAAWRQTSAEAPLGLSSAQLELPPLAFPPQATLHLQQMRYDPTICRAIFRIRVVGAATTFDFDAFGRLPAGTLPAPLRPTGPASTHLAPRTRPRQPTLPVLVWPGKPTRLYMRGPAIEVTATALPLERGRLGQLVRARLLGTRRILRGRVAADGSLEIPLP